MKTKNFLIFLKDFIKIGLISLIVSVPCCVGAIYFLFKREMKKNLEAFKAGNVGDRGQNLAKEEEIFNLLLKNINKQKK